MRRNDRKHRKNSMNFLTKPKFALYIHFGRFATNRKKSRFFWFKMKNKSASNEWMYKQCSFEIKFVEFILVLINEIVLLKRKNDWNKNYQQFFKYSSICWRNFVCCFISINLRLGCYKWHEEKCGCMREKWNNNISMDGIPSLLILKIFVKISNLFQHKCFSLNL